MRNIIILCAVLLIAIAALAGIYFKDLAGRDNNSIRVLNYIPADAAVIVNFKNDESFYDIFKNYDLFNAILGNSRSAENARLKNFLFNEKFLEISTDKNIFISLHPAADSLEYLYSVNLETKYSDVDLEDILSSMDSISSKTLGKNRFEIHFTQLEKPIYLFLENGVALASFSQDLVRKALDQKSPRIRREIVAEINKTSAKNLNSPINLFINHYALPSYLDHFINGRKDGNTVLLNDTKGFSALSMNFKSDALMFNGISNPDTSKPNYLNLFLHQKAARNQIKKILAFNTANYIAYGLTDVKLFQKDLKIYFRKKGKLDELEKNLKKMQSSTGIDTERDISPLLDKEFSVIENSYGEKYAILKLTNGSQLDFRLQLISSEYSDHIAKLNYPDLFYYYFGDPLKQFSKPYYAIVDNYLIIANLPGVITNYLQAYNSELFISKNEDFKQYDQLVANESNISFFANTKNSKKVIRTALKSRYSKAFRSKGNKLENFYGLSYQWTSEGDHFFTNLYLSYNSSDSLTLKD